MGTKKNTVLVKNFYNQLGKEYMKSWESEAKRRVSEYELYLIGSILKKIVKLRDERYKLKVLDIGSGAGRIIDKLIESNVDLYSVDISTEMVDYMRSKYKQNLKIRNIGVHNIAEGLPKKWGKFDLITAMRVLYYTPTWKDNIGQAFDLLKKDGYFVFSMTNKYSSNVIPNMIINKSHSSYDTSIGELVSVLEKSGFSEYEIEGKRRLLDVFYDWCRTKTSATMLVNLERVLEFVFGKYVFVRMFYIIARK